jgi:hypothetical protein
MMYLGKQNRIWGSVCRKVVARVTCFIGLVKMHTQRRRQGNVVHKMQDGRKPSFPTYALATTRWRFIQVPAGSGQVTQALLLLKEEA